MPACPEPVHRKSRHLGIVPGSVVACVTLAKFLDLFGVSSSPSCQQGHLPSRAQGPRESMGGPRAPPSRPSRGRAPSHPAVTFPGTEHFFFLGDREQEVKQEVKQGKAGHMETEQCSSGRSPLARHLQPCSPAWASPTSVAQAPSPPSHPASPLQSGPPSSRPRVILLNCSADPAEPGPLPSPSGPAFSS